MKSPNQICFCDSGITYQDCCGIYHHGQPAPDAKALMRSRYCAYVLNLEDYLLNTWYPDTRPTTLNLTAETPLKWINLEIKQFEQTSPTTATVAFVARYKVNGKAERLSELSQFVLLDRWYYLAGRHD